MFHKHSEVSYSKFWCFAVHSKVFIYSASNTYILKRKSKQTALQKTSSVNFVKTKQSQSGTPLTFRFRTLSFSTTPSRRLTTESTAGQLLSVFSSSATTIVTWLVSRSMFFCAARNRLFSVSYGT